MQRFQKKPFSLVTSIHVHVASTSYTSNVVVWITLVRTNEAACASALTRLMEGGDLAAVVFAGVNATDTLNSQVQQGK